MQATLWIAGVYSAAGILFAGAFVMRGLEVIDPVAKNSPWGFRALLIPGTVTLWPLLARRWWTA